MFVSVIICTYRRAAEVQRLLICLSEQKSVAFEVLVVDGSGEDRAVVDAVESAARESAKGLRLCLIRSPAGLTRQRNVGLKHAQGDLICFLDDDVTVPPTFLKQVVDILSAPEHLDVGGITGYDDRNYPASINFRWKLRRWLGVVPSLEPGQVDRFGRNVPISFARPFTGFRPVGWLPGFCMIYRRRAMDRIFFDEQLPTYGGEDRDYSLKVGAGWRLLLCGDLHVEHHVAAAHRVAGWRQIRQTAFGQGRGFRQRSRTWGDTAAFLAFVGKELCIESLALVRHPTPASLAAPIARVCGALQGW
ncbi:MAG: glycosyltransferase family 2 protein, partial [Pirellulaceae bacterium]